MKNKNSTLITLLVLANTIIFGSAVFMRSENVRAEGNSESNLIVPEADTTSTVYNSEESKKITSVWGTSPVTFDSGTGELNVESGTLSPDNGLLYIDSENLISKTLIKKIILDGEVYAPENSSNLFLGSFYSSLSSIEGNLHTDNVVTMNSMFSKRGASSFDIDVSQWNTSKVTDMSFMFAFLSAQKLDVSKWDTSNVTDMNFMFYQTKASIIDVSKWDTSSVVTMISLFNGAELSTLDVSNWDTSNVTDMSFVFYRSKISTIDVSKWDVGKVRVTRQMFQNTVATTIDVSNWNTSKLENIYSMFKGSVATTIDVSKWDTSSLITTSNAFQDSKASVLDVSKWNTSKVNSMKYMFSGSVVKKLDLSNWDNSAVLSSLNQADYSMFDGCGQLRELKLGSTFKLNTQMNLPTIQSNDLYTGYWENIGSNGTSEQPKGDNIWTSSELMTKYDGSKDADTYVWQPVSASRVTLNVKDSSVFKGNNWTANDNFESATDRFGNQISITDITVSGSDLVNTNVPGAYQVTYTNGNITKTVTVTVLDYLLGDINNDGVVNIDDLIAFAVYLNTGETPKGVSEEYVKQAGNLDTTGSDPNAINIDDYIALIVILNNM